jgi:L-rhamnose mutarotase
LYIRLRILLVDKGDVITLAIIWDQLIAEMILLAGIIYFSIYLEQLIHRNSEKKEQKEAKKNVVKFIENDLQQRWHFIGVTPV